MLDRLVAGAIRFRGIIVISVAAFMGIGVWQYQQLPIDAFPDISPIMVPVFAEAHGMAPEEIERLIALPIEAAMNGLPYVTQIKSTSAFGIAVVYVYFEDTVDIYFARQLVAERLASVQSELPELHDPPTLGPISTGLGQIYMYYLQIEPNTDTQGKDPIIFLRDLNDWVVKRQLQAVPGVTDILSMGGFVLQYQIVINPIQLQRYELSINDIVEAVRRNNRNVGGQFLVLGSEENLVRGIGLLDSLQSIQEIPLKVVSGTSVSIGDIAEVRFGPEVRRGVVTRNGDQEIVSGIVMKLFGENTSAVIKQLKQKIEAVQASLPHGVRLIPYYDQSDLVQNASNTVQSALLLGAILVILVLFVFLGHIPSAAIVTLALPFCALVAIVGMRIKGISANLMSLGGIAIGIGMLGDGAIVMIENIHRHLRQAGQEAVNRPNVVLQGAKEVVRPIVFSILIIIAVFMPIFALQDIEKKMFSPLAYTICFALLGSILAAIIVAPALAAWVLKTTYIEVSSTSRISLVQRLNNGYVRLLARIIQKPRQVLLVSIIAFIGSMALLPFLGTEFIPTLEEGSIQINITNAPSVSLNKYTQTIQHLEKQVLAFPEVAEVVSRIGRPEAGSHPHPVNYAEMHVHLKPSRQWPVFKSKQNLIQGLNAKLSTYPGIQLNYSQPIQNMFDELLSGVKAQLAIKVFGENLSVLQRKAQDIKMALETVPGLVDLSIEQNYGQPQIQIIPVREACKRLGVAVEQVLEVIELAIGGEVIDHIFLNTRRYGIHVRYAEAFRNSPEKIQNLRIDSPYGPRPLSELAEIKKVIGPIQINREKNQRRWIIQGNIRGRDLGSVFKDVQARIQESVHLPPGYYIEFGGQFENQQRAMTRLGIIVPLVMLLTLLMLWMALNSVRSAFVIVTNVPLALIGGVLGLLITGEYLSVPASVGFIALFGIAVQNGMVLVTCINQLREKGLDMTQALINAGQLRFRPVLMTALTTVLGLLPLLLSQGIGAEVQRPLAIVVVFGLATSTLLTLFVLPVVYGLVDNWLRLIFRKKTIA